MSMKGTLVKASLCPLCCQLQSHKVFFSQIRVGIMDVSGIFSPFPSCDDVYVMSCGENILSQINGGRGGGHLKKESTKCLSMRTCCLLITLFKKQLLFPDSYDFIWFLSRLWWLNVGMTWIIQNMTAGQLLSQMITT